MQPERSESAKVDELRERFSAWGQDHVFRFWDALDAAGRERLAAQAARIDLELLDRIHRSTRDREPTRPAVRDLAPAPIERLPEHGGAAEAFERARERGEALLASARVAALVVAGGQGTRLGFEGPKGAFPIGPVTDRSLLELQAQRIRRALGRYGVRFPWYVMTSPATDLPTRALFAHRDCFGVPAEDVFLFCQATVPSLDLEGRLLLEAPDRIAESPDGHGGVFNALAESGALADMAKRGITTLSYYQVDNPLVRVLDPVLLGFHDLQRAEMSCKVVRKRDPYDKMGVVASIDGRMGIVEYTELEDAHRFAQTEAGELVYWAGNVAAHGLEVDFARRVAREARHLLPYHASAKKIPFVDAAGRPVRPTEPNGHKLERFVFDALAAARSVTVVEAHRHEEYSPVKNADGEDSPAAARRDLAALYRSWLSAAGLKVAGDRPIEIDHSVIDSREDVWASGIRSLDDGSAAVRLAPGTP